MRKVEVEVEGESGAKGRDSSGDLGMTEERRGRDSSEDLGMTGPDLGMTEADLGMTVREE